MFEEFHVPAFYLSNQAILSLYATGRTTGLVVEIGDGVGHTIPVYEGHALLDTVGRSELAGRDLTSYLGKLLNEVGLNSSPLELKTIREIKEKCCYVALDYQE